MLRTLARLGSLVADCTVGTLIVVAHTRSGTGQR